jgi:hypothetical protein
MKCALTLVALAAILAVASAMPVRNQHPTLGLQATINSTQPGFWTFDPYGFKAAVCALTGDSCYVTCDNHGVCIGWWPLTWNEYGANSLMWATQQVGFQDLGTAQDMATQYGIGLTVGDNNAVPAIGIDTTSGQPAVFGASGKVTPIANPGMGPTLLPVGPEQLGHIYLTQVGSQWMKFQITNVAANGQLSIYWFIF